MDLNAIMSNIYGEGSSQSFDSIGFSGGSIQQHRASIKYLDDVNDTTVNEEVQTAELEQGYRASKLFNAFPDITLSGGAKDGEKIFPSAEYIDNSDLQKFIKEFYLHYLIVNAHKNMILIVPPTNVLTKMIADFKAILKKENIEECSPQASQYAAKTDLAFKNYIFDVYGRSSANNDGFLYQVPYPEKTSKDIYRRTNRASKQYFFRFDGGKIEIADNEKLANSNSLKFLGKCDRAVLVLQGEVPTSAGGKSKVVSASMAGGAKRNVLKSCFLRCVRNNHSLDDAAYEFIARVSKASGASKVAKFYSGDFAHCAFSILAANEEGTDAFDFDGSEDLQLENEHSAIIDNYRPTKNIVKMDKVQAVLPKLLRDATSRASNGASANHAFVSNLRKMYGAIQAPKYMLAADIATALTKNNESYDSIRNALSIMSAVDAEDGNTNNAGETTLSGGSVYATSFKSGSATTTPLINSVYNALSASPFIGSIAKEYTPLLLQPSSMRHSAFEDHNAELLNDDDDDNAPKTESKGVCEKCGQPDCECDKNNGSDKKGKDELSAADFDIKAFF